MGKHTFPGAYTEGARVYHSANQDFTTGDWAALAFDTELYDTDGIHDNVTNNSRLTCKTAGKYLIIGSTQWSANATGERVLKIRLNNTSDIAYVSQNASDAGVTNPELAIVHILAVGDYVELFALQNSGATRYVYGGTTANPRFMMQRIG